MGQRALAQTVVEILEKMSDAFVAIDREWRCVYVNGAAERLVGRRRDEMLGRIVWEVFEQKGTEFERACRRAMHERVTVHFVEYYAPLETWFEDTVYPSEHGITVYARDITERKRAEQQLLRSRDQLRALAAKLQHAREEERKRVAREIHDELGQALSSITIDLAALIRELPPRPPQPLKRAESILKLADETIQSVRRLATELRPSILDDLGLVAAVEWAIGEFRARMGIRCLVSLPGADTDVDPERSTALFRILQETLTNVARHANATAVDVRLARETGCLTLEIRDNGIGFDEGELRPGRSLGLLGMRERALLLRGELTIHSAASAGTTVTVRMPDGREADEP